YRYPGYRYPASNPTMVDMRRVCSRLGAARHSREKRGEYLMALPMDRAHARMPWGRLSRSGRRNLRNGLLFTAPGIIGLFWFYAYPVLASLFYSFTSYDGL